MKFEIIEEQVKLGNTGYVRHLLKEMPDGELVQRCVVCGRVVNDYTLKEGWVSLGVESGKDGPYKERGMAAGYVYVSNQRNPSTIIHEILKELGAKMPENFVDCTTLNS